MNNRDTLYLEAHKFIVNNNFSWNLNEATGELECSKKNIIQLKNIEEKFSDFCELTIDRINGKTNILSDLTEGELINCKLLLQRNSGIFIGKNLYDLIATGDGKYCREKPHEIFLTEPKWNSINDSQPPPAVAAYLATMDFIEYLKENIATHYDNRSILLIGATEKVEIPIILSADPFTSNTAAILDSIASIKTLVGTRIRKDEKDHHLKAVLVDFLSKTDNKTRLNHLIFNLEEIKDRFYHNFELFISNFSFETDYEKIQIENREYTKKIAETTSGIQGRIIAIPFGTILPAIAISFKTQTSNELNLVILTASIFLVVTILILLESQRKTLKSVRSEYKRKQKRMKNEIPTLAKRVEESYKDLNSQYRLNILLIHIVMLAAMAFLTYPIFTYFK